MTEKSNAYADYQALQRNYAEMLKIAELQCGAIAGLTALVDAQRSALDTTYGFAKDLHTSVRRAASLDGRALRSDARKLVRQMADIDIPAFPDLPKIETDHDFPALVAELKAGK